MWGERVQRGWLGLARVAVLEQSQVQPPTTPMERTGLHTDFNPRGMSARTQTLIPSTSCQTFTGGWHAATAPTYFHGSVLPPTNTCKVARQPSCSSCAHWNQVFSKSRGMISRRPSRTAAQPSAAMPWQLTHHWGLSTGSMTSLELRGDEQHRGGMHMIQKIKIAGMAHHCGLSTGPMTSLELRGDERACHGAFREAALTEEQLQLQVWHPNQTAVCSVPP